MERYELEKSIKTSVKMIREKAGADGKVIVLVSGGVDSMVTAALLLKALPSGNVYAIHVDHGFMRKNESKLVSEMLDKFGFENQNVIIMKAQDEYLNGRVELNGALAPPLREVSDPELKREIIGTMFIEMVKKAADKFNLDYDKTFIAQGTLRPDLIESANPDIAGSKKVKTHHNDVDIVRSAREKGMIIETNWNWYKEDVRQVARILGIGEETASRQPFPGPGLAVRIICAGDNAHDIPQKQSRLDEFLNTSKISGVVAEISSVGVKDKSRSYKNLCVLYGGSDYSEIARVASEIPDNLDFINRCVYALNKKSVDGLVRNKLEMSAGSAALIREIDYIVTSEISKFLSVTANSRIEQYFGVLVPVSTGGAEKYSAVIRAVLTKDYMAAHAALPGRDIPADVLQSISDKILELGGIDLVLYDMTGKPPATIEWE